MIVRKLVLITILAETIVGSFIIDVRQKRWSSSGGSNLHDVRKEMLNEHNRLRQRHGVQNLMLSEKLNDFAQEWAEILAQSGAFEHRPDNKYGENLFMGYRTGAPFTGTEAADDWYNEKDLDQCKTNELSEINYKACGHYTQMVWKESKHLGVGWVQTQDGTVYFVCNYDPPGNVQGYYNENVLGDGTRCTNHRSILLLIVSVLCYFYVTRVY